MHDIICDESVGLDIGGEGGVGNWRVLIELQLSHLQASVHLPSHCSNRSNTSYTGWYTKSDVVVSATVATKCNVVILQLDFD